MKLCSSPVEHVPLCALSQPGRAVTKSPAEAEVSPGIDPAAHRRRPILQDRGRVHEPVEPHCSLDHQRERLGGDGRPTSRRNCNYGEPTTKRGIRTVSRFVGLNARALELIA